ncbi:MAG: 4-alpha-glucanotransferase, partial [Saprospiraceae bacterium]|nr:4-alpha-glucanotransferase [Saprospiraceae bacterium]
MKLQFNIHYKTLYGQQLAIYYSIDNKRTSTQMLLDTSDGVHWIGDLNLSVGKKIQYHYVVIEDGQESSEAGDDRMVTLPKNLDSIIIQDQWRAKHDKTRIFQSSAFRDIWLKREKKTRSRSSSAKKTIQFRLAIPDIPSNVELGIVGNTFELGEWKSPMKLGEKNFPIWETTISPKSNYQSLEYKFVILHPDTGEILLWEAGKNRTFHFNFPENESTRLIISQEGFHFAKPWWRAAGVAIPIFSLRSKSGLGIGEFSDLIPMSDWAEKAGMKIIQTLPVNDTLASMTWVDSYPYAAISVFALHPLYINVEKIAPLTKKADKDKYRSDLKKLNKKKAVDFEAVLETKFRYFKTQFEDHGEEQLGSTEFKKFFRENKEWLVPYAAFSVLRDRNGSPEFSSWSEYASYDEKSILAFCKTNGPNYKEVSFYYFLQYHADRQLKEARAYAAEKGIVLKGDLPIGIYRFSADAWVTPHLYNMDEQAGAPPDDYAVLGQNWGFPTYNWEEMSKDNFSWWQKRMQKLAEYFDALRIDHILGFFRIWQIPMDQITGTLGMFNPRLPYFKGDLQRIGLTGDPSYFTKPMIHVDFVKELFEGDADWVTNTFLENGSNGFLQVKDFIRSQKDVKEFFEQEVSKDKSNHLDNVLLLLTQVLLIEEPGSNGEEFNPRITLPTTDAYKRLNSADKAAFDRIYHDYFYVRHEEYWKKQAIWKLPAILDATDMFICGEDLG